MRTGLPEYSIQAFHDESQLTINQHYYLMNNVWATELGLLFQTESRMTWLELKLPFHNDLHHVTVTSIAVYIATQLGEDLLIPSLLVGGMYHDRWYNWSEDMQVKRLSQKFSTKEDLAQELMHKNNPWQNMKELLQQASIAIDGTRVVGTNNEDEIARILWAADRQLIGVDRELYVYNTFKLFQERLLLNPELQATHSFEDFWKEAGPFLQRFIDMENELPEKYFPLAQGKYYENLKKFSTAAFPSADTLATIIPDWEDVSRDIQILSA